MICFVALFVFAFLALFSAKYRMLAAEAFDCVFRRITFRPCNSSLDKRLKSQITGKVLKRNKRVGRFVFRHFELLSWAFLILFTLASVYSGIGLYNYAVHGNCHGPDSTGFCIFDPLGTHQPLLDESGVCSVPPGVDQRTALSAPSLSDLERNPRTGSANAPVTIVEFGCFACPNTAVQAPVMKELIKEYGTNIQFVYVDFPLPHHEYAFEASRAAYCVHEQDPIAYWHYHFTLFEKYKEFSDEQFLRWAVELGMEEEAFVECYPSDRSRARVEEDFALGQRSGVYGTPTFFINEQAIVGYQQLSDLNKHIKNAQP